MAENGKDVDSMFGQLNKLVGRAVGDDRAGLDRDIGRVAPGHGLSPDQKVQDYVTGVFSADHRRYLKTILETDMKKYGKLLEKIGG